MMHVVTTGEDTRHLKVSDRTPPIFVPEENNTNMARQQSRYKELAPDASLVAETTIGKGTSAYIFQGLQECT